MCGRQITARTRGFQVFDDWLAYYREHQTGSCPRCYKALRRYTAYSVRLVQADAHREQEFGPPQPPWDR